MASQYGAGFLLVLTGLTPVMSGGAGLSATGWMTHR